MSNRLNHEFHKLVNELAKETNPVDLISWISSLTLRKWAGENIFNIDKCDFSSTVKEIFKKSNFGKFNFQKPNQENEKNLKKIWSLLQGNSPSNTISSIIYYLPEIGRAELDQVFTPIEIVRYIIQSREIQNKIKEYISNDKIPLVLEPGCAHSPFLSNIYDSIATYITIKNEQLNCKQHQKILNHLYGIDLDPFSLVLGKISLITKLPYDKHNTHSLNSSPNLFLLDFLENENNNLKLPTKFDIIVGNPPYGQIQDKNLRKHFRKEYASTISGFINVCGLFIHKSVLSLKHDGALVFLIASPVLTSDYNKALRKYLMNNGEISSLLRFESRTNICPNILQDFSIIGYRFQPKSRIKKIEVAWTQDCVSLKDNKINKFNIQKNFVILGEKDNYRFLVLPSKKDHEIFHKALSHLRLNEISKGVSTGQIVQHRMKDSLTNNEGTVLVRQQDLKHRTLKINKIRSQSIFYNLKCFPKHYIFNTTIISIKRMTSKEQPHRIHATIIEGNNYCLDNKINFLRCPQKLIEPLADYLTSDFAEYFFRGLSSTTQVNAKEINSIPTPDIDFLLVIKQKTKDFESKVAEALGLNRKDIIYIKSTLKNNKF